MTDIQNHFLVKKLSAIKGFKKEGIKVRLLLTVKGNSGGEFNDLAFDEDNVRLCLLPSSNDMDITFSNDCLSYDVSIFFDRGDLLNTIDAFKIWAKGESQWAEFFLP